MSKAPPAVRALVFDVFGTVVDWFGSIVDEVERTALPVDGPAFARAWRAGYQPAMQAVRTGALPWTTIDGLHRQILDGLLRQHAIALPEAAASELNRVWHRLKPWPDAVPGLLALKERQIVATLSNGNVSLLVNMARQAGLPWDTVLSAELFGHYKPDPTVYLGAARLLGLKPAEVMMVAAHPSDLRAAAACGLRTAYVHRPLEQGPGGEQTAGRDEGFDIVADDFIDLDRRLRAP